MDAVNAALTEFGLTELTHDIGTLNSTDMIEFSRGGVAVLADSRVSMRTTWAQTTFEETA